MLERVSAERSFLSKRVRLPFGSSLSESMCAYAAVLGTSYVCFGRGRKVI